MINVLLCEPNTPLGLSFLKLTEKKPNIRVRAALDVIENESTEVLHTKVKTYFKPEDIKEHFDIIIDAGSSARPYEVQNLINLAAKLRCPIIMNYESYSPEKERLIADAAKYLPIFRASHLSLNNYLFIETCASLAQVWSGDIEVIESNCNSKPVPCPIAVKIAEKMIKARGFGSVIEGRISGDELRKPGDICITSVRGGIIAGEYEVRYFNGDCQFHATAREYGHSSFAMGLVRICEFMMNVKSPGLFGVTDVINSKRKEATNRASAK